MFCLRNLHEGRFEFSPEKPGGQVQIEEESTEAQLAFGPQASRIAHGSYLDSLFMNNMALPLSAYIFTL